VNRTIIFAICGVALMLLLYSMSCSPSPQDFAEATVIAARPGATATAAAPSVHATATAVVIESRIKEATEDDLVAFWENVIWWGTIATCVLIVVGVVVVGKLVYRTGDAAGKATQKKLDLTASVVHVSKRTKTWPILVDWDRGRLLNLETGERVDIWTIAPADSRLIAISHRVREAGIYADAAVSIAAKSKSPQPGDMLPSVAASVPLLDTKEENDV